MGKHRSKTAAVGPATLLLGFLIACSGWQAAACGYHDDVSLARGVLNWTYPDALHVVGAISTAVAERRLPAPAPARGGFGTAGYHGIARVLDQHAQQLPVRSDRTANPAFSLLLVEPMLWTRFASEGDGVISQPHVSGPRTGDLVVISGEDVIREIAHNRLSIGEAHRQGLLRLYGTEEQLRAFLTSYHQVGSRRSE